MIWKFLTVFGILAAVTTISVQGAISRHPGILRRTRADSTEDSASNESGDDVSEESRIERSNDQEVVTGRDLGFQRAALDTINFFRDDHSAPSLSLDAGLNSKAQAWADHLASGNLNPTPSCSEQVCKYGESISIVSISGEVSDSDTSGAVRRVIRAWYAQGRNYDFRRQGLGSEIGNDFTQLIWKASRKMGVGVGRNAAGDRLYVVVQYSPAGNRRGLFSRNVLPAFY